MLQPLAWLWASPNTAIGLLVGALNLASGGHVQSRAGIIEFHGPFIRWLLTHLPGGSCFSAMTLGHVVIGQTADLLDVVRKHELVHVRQYERWGPLFLPAYLACSAYLWLRRRDYYRDNPFEREAYHAETIDAEAINQCL